MCDYDDFYYGPRCCDLQEQECVSESVPGAMDTVVKKFADILADGAERAVFDYDDLPETLTAAIVLNFPDIGLKKVMIYSLDEWNAHLLTQYASQMAETEIELPRARLVTGDLTPEGHHKKTNCSIRGSDGGY
jgi:hypothetical protein